MLNYERHLKAQQELLEEDSSTMDFRELMVADYMVFLLALDTYMRYLDIVGDAEPSDPILARGLMLLRKVEGDSLDATSAFIKSNLATQGSKNLIDAALRQRPSPEGAAKRALLFRTALSRGGAPTVKSVFGASTKARREVLEAIEASKIDDPDQALNKFASLVLRDKRLEKWIDKASEAVLPGTATINPIQEATKGSTDASLNLFNAQVEREARPGTDESSASRDQQANTLSRVEAQATGAAKKAMQQSGEQDRVLTKAEVIGVATATVTAAMSDPDKPQNVPPALQGLDPDQRSAALTGGKVRVAAAAGSGKSTTLLARIKYLIDGGVIPSRILAMSFNTKAANELGQKLALKIGSDKVSTSKSKNPRGVKVGTMHSTFLEMINDYGSPEQVDIFAKVNGKGGLVSASTLFKSVKSIWAECFRDIDKDPDRPGKKIKLADEDLWKMPPKSKRMMAYLNLFQGQGMSLAKAKEWAGDEPAPEVFQALKFFEVYEGLKGVLGEGWNPDLCGPRPSPTFDKFRDFNRAGKKRVGDFNDMLTVLRDILRASEGKRKKIQERFDHTLVDECQDLNPVQFEVMQLMTEHISSDDPKKSFWMVGDDKQCPSGETPILTPQGNVLAKNIRTGDEVFAWRNGELVSQKAVVSPSSWSWGYKIKTSSGRSLTISPNHKIWASTPVLKPHQVAVCLMFRSDMGFRVGTTDCQIEPLRTLALQDGVEKLWVLSIHDTHEKAKMEGAFVSLQYGIPQLMLGGSHGLNSDYINKTFKEFGRNGLKLMESRHINPDLPHFVFDQGQRVVQLLAHAPKFSVVQFQWTKNEDGINPLEEVLTGFSYETMSQGSYRLRKGFTNYREAQAFAVSLARKAGATLSHTLSTPEGSLQKVTASCLFPGMKVSVLDQDTLFLDEIESVERVEDTFINLEVEDASNFFGGGILSHNSIYEFRGSDPNNFIALDKMGFKDKQMTTNYRCAPEFVEAANKLIAHNKNQIPMEAKADPNRPRGDASLLVKSFDEDAKAAADFGKKMLAAVRAGENLADFAVLARTNGELAAYQQICAVIGLRYVQKRASSVFASQETETFRAFAAAVVPTDPKVIQDNFCQTLISTGTLRPRFSTDRAENIKQANDAMKRYIQSYCSRNKLNVGKFDPVEAARQDPEFLLGIYKDIGGVPGFAARAEVENASGFFYRVSEIRSDMENPNFTSKDLFEAILALPVAELIAPEPGSRKWTTEFHSFREITEKRLSAKVAQEGAEEDLELQDETSLLGTLSFIQMMMEPNSVDPEYNPLDPKQFHAKFEGLSSRAEELRIDPDQHEKEQISQGIPLAQRLPPPGVFLGTVHSTKGAEWPDVTLLMSKGSFPIQRKPRPLGENEVPEEPIHDTQTLLEAERRLGYVGLTRAKKNLTIFCTEMSLFISEAGLHIGQNISQPQTVTPGAEPATSADFDIDVVEELDWVQEAEQGTIQDIEKTASLLTPYTYARGTR
jgi:superfamily I DNA/RNA helicase